MILCSGDEEPANTAASAPLKNEPQPPPQHEPPQTIDNVKVERATDPRQQPAPAYDDGDADREFARNGGGQWQEDTHMRDNRPNPNKHEDG
jgi:hypothetical protein